MRRLNLIDRAYIAAAIGVPVWIAAFAWAPWIAVGVLALDAAAFGVAVYLSTRR